MADSASSVSYNPCTEWARRQYVFDDIVIQLGQVEIYLLSYYKICFIQYVSWEPEPKALHIDAFTSMVYAGIFL